MSAISRHLSTPVPQTRKADPRQAKNNAGGFSFVVNDQNRLERFLILGTDGGTYYVSEPDLTEQNLVFIDNLIKADPLLVHAVTKDVSVNGRAYRNTPAVYVAARLMVLCDAKDKELAKDLFLAVCRTSYDMFTYCQLIDTMGGWGQAKMDAVRRWYNSKTPEQLAYQAVKYRQRNGWTHRDVMRLVHPKGLDRRVGDFMLHGNVVEHGSDDILSGFQVIQGAKTVRQVVAALESFKNLPWETIPTQFLRAAEVWKTLFFNGQLRGQALLRNMKRLREIGAFDDILFSGRVGAMLADEEMIRKTRLHPMQYLFAMNAIGSIPEPNYTYWRSRSEYRDDALTGPVRDGLEEGFYASFRHSDTIKGSTLLAVDVSGSMSSPIFSGGRKLGIYREASELNQISCAQAAGAMAMVFAKNSEAYAVRGFAGEFRDLGISASDSLSAVMKKVYDRNFGRTDCALPMTWAEKNKVHVDNFIVLTDNETWYGGIHPHKALESYRKAMNPKAKLVVVGMTGNEFTIADPYDAGSMDVVGFDANAAKVISDFANQ